MTELKQKGKAEKIAIMCAIIAICFFIFGIIQYFYDDIPNQLDEATMQCIADNSQLYAMESCKHCVTQKEWLGNYSSLFDIVYCDGNNICVEKGIEQVPYWIIKEEGYLGIKTPEELKGLTEC